ncbi:MAG TPA: hypothetical protein DIT64_15430 [Verrucomicrobiales bacterium]|nr:hypothetical protein [Verrucomicrobiales bacterium]
MLLKILLIILVIAIVLGTGMILEIRRERALREWASGIPGARLHWPFIAVEHPSVPAAELVELLIQRAPVSWASAIETRGGSGDVWLVEYRATPPGKKSTRWFTLVAWRRNDLGSCGPLEHADAGARTLGRWSCRVLSGLITVSMLHEILGEQNPRPR